MASAKTLEKQQARLLRSQGKSMSEISKLLHVSKSSVSCWVGDIRLNAASTERLQKREAEGAARGREKNIRRWQEYRIHNPKPEPDFELRDNLRKINSFFRSWSDKMAYVLGFFAADGCMYHSRNGGHSTGGLYIDFHSTDRDLIQLIKKTIAIRNKIEVNLRNKPHKDKYFLRIVNKRAFQDLLALGMTPRKSLTLSFPTVPSKHLSHFVRGYFDGDGHVSYGIDKGKGRSMPRRRIETGFTSGSQEYLKVLQTRLRQEAHMGFGSLHPHNGSWELSYAAKDSRQLYKFMYPNDTVPCLKRKRDKFELALDVSGPMV